MKSRKGIPKLTNSPAGKFGEEARAWKGEQAGYYAKHIWLRRHYKAEKCEDCGAVPPVKLEFANISGEYKRDRSDYRVLCHTCHMRRDFDRPACRNGHIRTPENTRMVHDGRWKQCKDCCRAAGTRYRARKRAAL